MLAALIVISESLGIIPPTLLYKAKMPLRRAVEFDQQNHSKLDYYSAQNVCQSLSLHFTPYVKEAKALR